ncbi:sigma-70 family RNA polymerase sigma factor [Fulvivirga sp.]|uniref:RNA polymerase sigma factor n=1 Tax=Fulvivirga sp. TaxID=1931237 RepID=UPI0032EE4F37
MAQRIDEAFLELINQNLRIAHKICRVYFDTPNDRDDAFQEMMYQLWRSYPKFSGRSKFSTWMYRVCLNTALTYQGKVNRNQNQRLETSHQIAEATDNVIEENLDAMYKSIGTLSPLNKAIILLYIDELSYEEIATITGITKGNVSVRIVRIKKELEEKISKILNT